ncbi:MAG: hypothetical protein PHG02_07880 [Oscillospiraceae bacterium]|nr:hypothetical protein [Oscillospiraceae bacterium]
MLVESLAIIAMVVAAFLIVFVRTGNIKLVGMFLPVLIIPVTHIISIPLSKLLFSFMPEFSFALLRIFIDVSGLAVACICIGIGSLKIKAAKRRTVYIIFMGCYCLLLTYALINNAQMLI